MNALTAPAVADVPPAGGDPNAGLALVNLLGGPGDLVRHLVERVEEGDTLNAFLLAAGLLQIAEDVLEGDRLRLAEAHRVLGGGGPRLPARVVAAATSALATLPRGLGPVRTYSGAVGALTDELADMLVAGGQPSQLPALARKARALFDDLPSVAALQAGVLRLPACFRGFDQHPEDVRRLTDAFAAARGDRHTPIAVVGVRTSGSYLAPLTAACLRTLGYSRASALTARPSHAIDARKRRLLGEVMRAGGLVIVTDDPPATGDSIVRVANALESLGFPRASIVPMFATHAGSSVPPALRDYACVTLPWEGWSIHDRLEPDAVARSLSRLWPGVRVGEVTRAPLADEQGRGQVAARYRAWVEAPSPAVRELFVRGVGLGYFGDHSLAVAAQLEEWVPQLHGVVDGLAFRDWIPDEAKAPPRERDVAEYAAARARLLPLDRDPTPGLRGQDPVWEVASNILSRAFARGWRALRVSALDSMMRELLRPARACVIDGRMDPGAWYTGLVKVKADEGAFSNRNLACCDAAFDVAAAAALGDLDGARLRAEFARASGDSVDDERWLIYQLVAAWTARRDGRFGEREEEHVSARALRLYFASLFLDGVPRRAGAFCALDIDGVLETETLGFPGLSPAGALALRALLAHGYRPVVASGRSIGEVRDRCREYGLAGGVAEYGAAAFDAARDEVQVLVPSAAAEAVARARAALAGRHGVEIGADHLHTIRAWRRDERGRRGPLLDRDVDAALGAAGSGALRPVSGEGQTDLVPAGVDKAGGLRALTTMLGAEDAQIALAVGDTVEDLPMLRLARLAIAPANADPALRRTTVPIARRSYQSGLAEAVAGLIGHAPGGCSACAPPPRDRRADLVLGVLGARGSGPVGLGTQALRVTRLVWRGHATG